MDLGELVGRAAAVVGFVEVGRDAGVPLRRAARLGLQPGVGVEPRSGGGDADDQVERAAVGGVPGLQDDRALEAARPARAEGGADGARGRVGDRRRKRHGGLAPLGGDAAAQRHVGAQRPRGCAEIGGSRDA